MKLADFRAVISVKLSLASGYYFLRFVFLKTFSYSRLLYNSALDSASAVYTSRSPFSQFGPLIVKVVTNFSSRFWWRQFVVSLWCYALVSSSKNIIENIAMSEDVGAPYHTWCQARHPWYSQGEWEIFGWFLKGYKGGLDEKGELIFEGGTDTFSITILRYAP